jgi:hypothetical protein
MKKTYSSPEIKTVRVMQRLMQDGASLTGRQGSQSFNISFSNDEYDGEAASRRHSQWDDEEEEDF